GASDHRYLGSACPARKQRPAGSSSTKRRDTSEPESASWAQNHFPPMAHHTITATELKFAVLEPEWRAKWLAGQKPSTRSFAPAGSPRALSLQFHREAEKLVVWLTAPESLAAAAKVNSIEPLVDHLWATSLQALTDELFARGLGQEAAIFT